MWPFVHANQRSYVWASIHSSGKSTAVQVLGAQLGVVVIVEVHLIFTVGVLRSRFEGLDDVDEALPVGWLITCVPSSEALFLQSGHRIPLIKAARVGRWRWSTQWGLDALEDEHRAVSNPRPEDRIHGALHRLVVEGKASNMRSRAHGYRSSMSLERLVRVHNLAWWHASCLHHLSDRLGCVRVESILKPAVRGRCILGS
mmetsp:Transcript_21907/g.47157  ORF Transcript_21907/g.47157 Transcript_21907/m.47157 type:complete len:200 (+) Transcript_21907:547-1146(+)